MSRFLSILILAAGFIGATGFGDVRTHHNPEVVTSSEPIILKDQGTQTEFAHQEPEPQHGFTQKSYVAAGATAGLVITSMVAQAFLQDYGEYSDLEAAREFLGELCGLDLTPELAYLCIMPIFGSAAGAGVGMLGYGMQANLLDLGKSIHRQLPNRPNFGSWLPNPTLNFFYGMFSVSMWPKK